MATLKLISLLLCWGAVVAVLARRYSRAGAVLASAAAAAFVAGVVLQNLLFGFLGGEMAFKLVRSAAGIIFIALWALSVAALYRAGGASLPRHSRESGNPDAGSPIKALGDDAGGVALGGVDRGVTSVAAVTAVASGALAGAISLAALASNAAGTVAILPCAALAVAGAAMAVAATALGRRLPAHFTAKGAPLAALVISGILFMACSVQRLDLFSPLSMEVMKFIHDFVHQFFESMLIPDHPFFRSDVWDYIGILFSDKVGFWGGLLIWFTPILLVLLAVRLQRLPSVAHIRQGAQRRKLLASFIHDRRLQLVLPLIALVFLTAAVYRSRFPSVEYWDPKPLPVAADASGEILIPMKGEVDLEDGKLHKYLLKQSGKEVRFFVLMTASGRLTVDLDACAICKPDGYGQSGETVICYYCKTLIPLGTVGKPGGCNPVPIPFVTKGSAVSISAAALVSRWSDTIQETAKVKGGGR